MSVVIKYRRYFGVNSSVVTEKYFFIESVTADPVFIIFRYNNGESVRVYRSHLINLEIGEDPETLIL